MKKTLIRGQQLTPGKNIFKNCSIVQGVPEYLIHVSFTL